MFMGGDARTIASQCRISETFVEAHIKGGEGVVWVGGDNGLWSMELWNSTPSLLQV
jgi:hypothetical protein